MDITKFKGVNNLFVMFIPFQKEKYVCFPFDYKWLFYVCYILIKFQNVIIMRLINPQKYYLK